MPTQLLKLLADNRGKGSFRAEATGDQATVYLYDVIVADDMWGGVSALTFAKTLSSIDAPVINLRINSPGGDVFAARAMEATIREHKSQIVAHIDGEAASAATYVALAADTVKMSDGGFFMIHKAWSVALGNADDMLQMAALLEKVDESLVATYANHTGKDQKTISDWMANETWFSAQEALDAGFIDEITTAPIKARNQWNLSAYAHAPKMAESQCVGKYSDILMKVECPLVDSASDIIKPEQIIMHDKQLAHMHRMAALARHL